MKAAMKIFLKPIFEFISQLECKVSSKWTSSAHGRLLKIQWGYPPQPEHFDHHIDLYYQWKEGYPFWIERGFVGNMCAQTLLLKKDKLKILDLCCGDGFYSKYFYAYSASSITCIDFDKKAISTAINKNSSPKIKHIVGDIRYNFPEEKFDLIIWDAAFEHFTINELKDLISKIKNSLVNGGILACYTIQERPDKQKQLSHHEYEPKSKEDFASFFREDFININVFETIYEVRHNLYLVASDEIIPFSYNWPMMNSYQ